MIKIKFSVLPFIKGTSGRVALRVRWSSNAVKRQEVDFISGVYAEKDRWDSDSHKAKKSTTHHVRNMSFTASEINARISEFEQAIDDSFSACSLKNTVPTPQELKDMVNKVLCRVKQTASVVEEKQEKTLEELLQDFIQENAREKTWSDKCRQKYVQAYHHLTGANPKLKFASKITIDTMRNLKDWYIEKGYKNRTARKQTTMLKCFLKWINNQEGYSIPKAVLDFDTNLKVIRRTVTFLHYDELLRFSQFQFGVGEGRLSKARDLWCFMAFTSLRYSDLCNLKTGHIQDKQIEMMTQKTCDRIIIPLTDGAIAILNKYKGKETADGHVFDVPSNQKLNDYVKEAAKVAKLDRVILEDYIIGRERKSEQHKFYEIISCHDARRTFVSCSLAMGISPQVVMKCTGHKGYNTMKPYIETATETQALEMEKWNRNQYRSQIITRLEEFKEDDLKLILDYVKSRKTAV